MGRANAWLLAIGATSTGSHLPGGPAKHDLGSALPSQQDGHNEEAFPDIEDAVLGATPLAKEVQCERELDHPIALELLDVEGDDERGASEKSAALPCYADQPEATTPSQTRIC